jgi:hypothetical protein
MLHRSLILSAFGAQIAKKKRMHTESILMEGHGHGCQRQL